MFTLLYNERQINEFHSTPFEDDDNDETWYVRKDVRNFTFLILFLITQRLIANILLSSFYCSLSL